MNVDALKEKFEELSRQFQYVLGMIQIDPENKKAPSVLLNQLVNANRELLLENSEMLEAILFDPKLTVHFLSCRITRDIDYSLDSLSEEDKDATKKAMTFMLIPSGDNGRLTIKKLEKFYNPKIKKDDELNPPTPAFSNKVIFIVELSDALAKGYNISFSLGQEG